MVDHRRVTLGGRGWVGATCVGAVVACALALVACSRSQRSSSGGHEASSARFVGSATCGTCHAAEYTAWKGSHHALAMQEARVGAVLGRFDSARFTDAGVTSTFSRQGDRYVVNTEGADGALHDFTIRYTFGEAPLQQYLVELTRGRVQTLPMAWDNRPSATGGQRWYTVFPGPRVAPSDALHWDGRLQSWNHRCADCHSTDVRKGYDAAADSFATTRSEISVGCEACHGPGSSHATWATYPAWVRRVVWHDDRLPAALTERDGVRWTIDSATGNAARSVPRRTDHEIGTCAQCHSRRVHVADGYTAGARFLDFYDPDVIVPGLYYADGQQRDEVYVYGSFLQSKMYHAGVTCADCHDPHTQQLRRPGNQLCTQCHLATKYDTVAHHRHPAGSLGAQCVACHMPDSAYMQIQPRRDHSIRIPRPDLSVSLGVPNPCTRCHTTRDAQWAAAQLRAWYGKTPVGFQRFAGAFAVDEHGGAGAADSLGAIASDTTEPAIVRASALTRLAAHPGTIALQAARVGSHDPEALVRLAALRALESVAPKERVAVVAPRLGDDARTVRLEAAWLMAPMSDSLTSAAERLLFASAAAEVIASGRYNADRPASRLALGAFYAQLGDAKAAIAEYSAALRLTPDDAALAYAYASALRASGRAGDAIAVLESARAYHPTDRDLLFALGAFERDAGDTASARKYATLLLEAHPGDAGGEGLLRSLRPH